MKSILKVDQLLQICKFLSAYKKINIYVVRFRH